MNSTPTTPTERETRPLSQTDGVARVYLSPRVDILETKDAYVLEAEMPGVPKGGLEILLEDNELTLVGHRLPSKSEADLVYRESTPRDFRRVFALDPTIDTAKIEAKLEDGVLILRLPKAEQIKPRRINVND